jgi:hypothetical protein
MVREMACLHFKVDLFNNAIQFPNVHSNTPSLGCRAVMLILSADDKPSKYVCATQC